MSATSISLHDFVRSVFAVAVLQAERMSDHGKERAYQLMDELREAGCRDDGRAVKRLTAKLRRHVFSEAQP